MSRQDQLATDGAPRTEVPRILVDRLGELAKRNEQIEIEHWQPVDPPRLQLTLAAATCMTRATAVGG